MSSIYQDILISISKKKKLLAVLIDPDKMTLDEIGAFMKKLNASIATHVFVGGSTVADNVTHQLVLEIKEQTHLPVILFPGDIAQITNAADAILFLSLISGRNPEYLIGKQIDSVSALRATNLEILPTGYLLLESGIETAVQRVSNTLPLNQNNIQLIVDTAKAGELLGMKLIYLEAGSGAKYCVSSEIIENVKKEINAPLIVGGGIKSKNQLETAYNAGADMVVIGTAFENDESFFSDLG